MKRLPLNKQLYDKVVTTGSLYIDKTKYIYDLIDSGLDQVFLSRPRRFGKTLLVSTMAEVFLGHRELFADTWIGHSDYRFDPHPVIRLDLIKRAIENPDDFKTSLLTFFNTTAAKEGLTANYTTVPDAFGYLIENLSHKYGTGVVVLVDEYDSPLTEHIDDMKTALAMRDVLSSLFGVLKGSDEYLHFAFVTGVSTFAKTALFSKGSRFKDISLNHKYANICGFTREEFESAFADRISDERYRALVPADASLLECIYEWYDGYSWDGKTRVLNPLSILSFFEDAKFADYWYESATPLYLIKSIRNHIVEFKAKNTSSVWERSLVSMDIEHLELEPMLFQTGYMTIDREADTDGLIQLRTPNREVSIALHKDLMKHLTGTGDETVQKSANLLAAAFCTGEIEDGLKSFFSCFAHQTASDSSGHFSSLVYCALSLKGFDITLEESVGSGDIDMRITMPASDVFPDGAIYIGEWKHRTLNLVDSVTGKKKDQTQINKEIDALSSAGLSDAMSQIKQKGYAASWLASGKRIINLGICTVGNLSVKVRIQANGKSS